MIEVVGLYVCDKCDIIGAGPSKQVCLQCGQPMNLVRFVRQLTMRTPDLLKAEQPGKVYPGTWEEVDKSNDESASG